MTLPQQDIRTIDTTALEALERDRTLSDQDWRLVVAELARRASAPPAVAQVLPVSSTGRSNRNVYAIIGVMAIAFVVAALARRQPRAPSYSGPLINQEGSNLPSVDTGVAPGHFSHAAILWVSKASMDEGLGLFNQGIKDAQILGRLIQCTPSRNDGVAVLDGGMFSSKVVVTDGPEKGCVGWTPNEYFRSPKLLP